MLVTVYSAHNFEIEYLEKENKQHQFRYITEQLSVKTAELAAGSEAVALFTQDDASALVLNTLQALGVKYLTTRSAGYDHIDLQRVRSLQIKVAHVPAYSPYAIAEHAMALVMALNRKLIVAAARIKQNNYCLDDLIGFDMNGKTVGIIGLGKIGSVMAKIVHGFGCRILIYDVAPPVALEVPVEYVTLSKLLQQSDIISLHAPLTPETKYLINAESIKLLKKGSMLINTSRGGLINTKDLISALQTGQISAAGLDVYEKEKDIFFRDLSDKPVTDDLFAELKSLPNVLITGHQAFLTSTALQNIAETTIYNLDTWQNGGTSINELF